MLHSTSVPTRIFLHHPPPAYMNKWLIAASKYPSAIIKAKNVELVPINNANLFYFSFIETEAETEHPNSAWNG